MKRKDNITKLKDGSYKFTLYGKDIEDLSLKLTAMGLGHSDMVTTQIYAHVSNPELRKRIDDAFGVKSEVQKTLSKSKRQVQNVGYMPNQLTLAQASDPLQILKLRLVSGEITIDRYNKLKRILLN